MHERCRYPIPAIVFMVLICGLIGAVMLSAGTLVEFGRSLIITIAAAVIAAGVISLVLFVAHRAGVHRISELRTWYQS